MAVTALSKSESWPWITCEPEDRNITSCFAEKLLSVYNLPQCRSSAPLGQSLCPLHCKAWGRHSLMFPQGNCPRGHPVSDVTLLASSTEGEVQKREWESDMDPNISIQTLSCEIRQQYVIQQWTQALTRQVMILENIRQAGYTCNDRWLGWWSSQCTVFS